MFLSLYFRIYAMFHETHGAHEEEDNEVDLNLTGWKGLEQCF